MKSKHKTELRERPISESFCAQTGCRFRGKRVQQGVCYDSVPETKRDNIFVAEISAISARMGAERDEIRKSHYKGKDREWIRWLEGMYECAMLNWHLGTNETVRLRAENAILKDKLARKSK